MTTWGTSYFRSLKAAIRYYSDYEDDPEEAVKRKIEEESIHLGEPPLHDGERLVLLDGGLRYGVIREEIEK
jgi:hypothetical protein